MVNGKPQLIMGGGVSAPASSRQRAHSALKGAESFASYLPEGNSAQIARHGSSPAAGPPLARPAVAQGSRAYLGYMPDGYAMNQANQSVRQTLPQAAQPPGARTMAQARSQALPGSRAMLNNFGAMGNQPVAARSAPQLSGAPITGRGGIGMVDTRRTVARPAGNQTALTSQTVLPGAVAPPGSDPYASFVAYYGGAQPAQNRQSFVAHGFASKNAELAMKKLGYDMKQPPSLQTYARRLEPDPYSLKPAAAASAAAETGVTFGSTRPVRFPSGEEGARTAVQTASHRKKTEAAATSLTPAFRAMADQGLGRLAAKFESGDEGIAAIGYDRKGGTSYGKYQIASRVGTMRAFIDYLHDKAPDIAGRLEAAGPANTGGRSGRMPDAWRKIAAEDPERFETLQSDFIRNSHFEPAKQAIAAATGVAFDNMPQALQEVLFSTAVQHGPAGATRIVSQALKRTGADKLQSAEKKAEQQLITHIYNLRAGQFVSSTSRVQAAVRQRLKQEMREALQMLT